MNCKRVRTNKKINPTETVIIWKMMKRRNKKLMEMISSRINSNRYKDKKEENLTFKSSKLKRKKKR